VSCEEVLSLLSAHVDRELDLLKSVEVEAHLEACPRCTAEVRRIVAVSKALREAGLGEALPPAFDARIRRALREDAPRKQGHWLGLATAAVLVLGLFGARQLVRSSDSQAASEVVSAHIRSLLPDRLMDVESEDRHTVKPFFHGRLDYAPPVPDLGASGFTLLGGRVDVLERQRVAALVYKKRQHVINVFVLPEAGRLLKPPRLIEGYAVVGFSEGGFAFWAVSDIDPSDLERLPALVHEALTPHPASPPNPS
jgi:anti-sigma factor RsiW